MLAVIRASQSVFIAAGALICFLTVPLFAQQSDRKTQPIIVQPGAPGQPTKILSASTTGKLSPRSAKDVEFMQGMITHHAQAVEMAALNGLRTDNKDLRLIGARINKSQLDEMAFMKRWLEARGEPLSTSTEGMNGHTMDHHKHMPGMLTQKQMEALRKAKGAEFDRLFLEGMI